MRAYVIISYPSEHTREQWEVCAVVERPEAALTMGDRRFPKTQRKQAEAYARTLMSEVRSAGVLQGQ